MADGTRPDRNLALELVRTTEYAALACARWIGRGEKESADGAAQAATSSQSRVPNTSQALALSPERATGSSSLPMREFSLAPSVENQGIHSDASSSSAPAIPRNSPMVSRESSR